MKEGKYQNKYRILSTRLKGWDYGAGGFYFVTICAKDMKCVFGKIVNKKMILNEIGMAAKEEWLKTMKLRPYILLDEFVIMPNHVHMIVVLDKNGEGKIIGDGSNIVETRCGTTPVEMRRGNTPVETRSFASLQLVNKSNFHYKNKFGSQSHNLASIIRGYKSAVTQYARLHNINFCWQPSFHDHLIRTSRSLDEIRNYVVNNPARWAEDKFFVNNF